MTYIKTVLYDRILDGICKDSPFVGVGHIRRKVARSAPASDTEESLLACCMHFLYELLDIRSLWASIPLELDVAGICSSNRYKVAHFTKVLEMTVAVEICPSPRRQELA